MRFLNRLFPAWLTGLALVLGAAPALAQRQVELAPIAASPRDNRLPAHWQRGVFMEINVRTYQDSNGDGVGDIKGLIGRLDHLRDLGISAIWLMPVLESQDKDHGYATSHYREIESEYGSLADFDTLLDQAHQRGIAVVMDYSLNHSALTHPAYERSAVQGRFRDWYVWVDEQPTGWSVYGQNPWIRTDNGSYYASLWSQMPDFNLRNPEVVEWHFDNLRFWLNRGVDGFRIEAAGNLVENGPDDWENQPENDVLLRRVRELVTSYPNRYLVCDAATDAVHYAAAEVCGAAFAQGQNAAVIGAAAGEADALAEAAAYFQAAPQSLATFLSTHDSSNGARPWDQLDGDPVRLQLAAATYLLLPGTPIVYYGEEIGMSGGVGLGEDDTLRTPMSWTDDAKNAGFTNGTPFRSLSANVSTDNVASQLGDADSLLGFYKRLIALRQSIPALQRGDYVAPKVKGLLLSFQRVLPNSRALVMINHSTAAAGSVLSDLPPGATLTRRWPQAITQPTKAAATVPATAPTAAASPAPVATSEPKADAGTDATATAAAGPPPAQAPKAGGAAVIEVPTRLTADAKGQVTLSLPAQSFAVFELVR